MRDKFQNKGFNRIINHYRAKQILKYALGEYCLELGCGEGQITKKLINRFERVYAIDNNKNSLKYVTKKAIVGHDDLNEINYYTFPHVDYVVCSNVIEHLSNPKTILKKISKIGHKNTLFFFSVPNARSVNRILGSNCGILKIPESLGKHDIEAGHKKMYNLYTFSRLIKKSFKILENGSFCYKPFPNATMEILPPSIIKKCMEMKMNHMGGELFVVCKK